MANKRAQYRLRPRLPSAAEFQKAWEMEHEFGLPENLLTALINQESKWDPLATSTAGARGLTQMMPGTARMEGVRNPESAMYDPDIAMRYGAQHLAKLLKLHRGNIPLALEHYNRGRTGGRMPAETKKYIPAVMKYREMYNNPNMFAPLKRPGVDYDEGPDLEMMYERIPGQPVGMQRTDPIDGSIEALMEAVDQAAYRTHKQWPARELNVQPVAPRQPRVNQAVQQPARPSAPTGGTYMVRRGDNLTRIAKNLGVSLAHLIAMNNFDSPDRIFPGQQINY